MAEITRRRTGELIRIVVELLLNKPEGLPAQQILDHIPNEIKLTEYEKGSYVSSPGDPRYRKIVRFATVDLVKAGWLVKSQGQWILTEEGHKAYTKFSDPEKFYREAVRLYHDWKRTRPKKQEPEPESIEEVVEQTTFTFEEAVEKAWDQIRKHLQAMPPYDFQKLVADLLQAMGYHVSYIAPPGKDRGIDIIAYSDPIGVSAPRIKVQVKRREQAIDVEGLRAFLAVLGSEDVGLFVSSGGFTSATLEEARTQERRKVTLLDLQKLFDLWVEHYGNLTQEARQRLPLKPIYFLAPVE